MAADDQELANIDAELAKRGVPPESDEMAQLDAEMQRRKSAGGRLADVGQRAAKGLMFGPLGAQVAMSQPATEALDRGAYNAGGWVTDKASALGASPEVAAGAGVAANLGVQAAPMAIGGEAAKLFSPQSQAAGRWLMQQALKPSKAARDSGDAAKAIETLLQEGVNVTKGGVENLTARIDKLDSLLDQAIKNSGGSLDKIAALQPLKEVLAQYRAGTLAADSLDSIRGVARKFLDHPMLRGSDRIPVQVAQEMKRANYRELGDAAYGTGLKPASQRDALKGVTRGLKEGIEGQSALDAEYLGLPNAAKINAEMGPLINARDLAQDRVSVAANRNTVGLGAATPTTERMLLWLLDRSDLAKSMLARGTYSGSLPNSAGRLAGAAAGQATVGRRMTEEDLR